MFTEEFVFDLQRFDEFINEYDSTLISGTSAADTISNSGNLVTIKGYAGNDYISSSTHSNSLLATDYSPNGWGYVTIDAGAGNDTVYSYDPCVSITGGAGNDLIYNSSYNYVTMSGGTGNDTIYNSDGNYNVFKYDSGDGNDLIQGFNETSTLSISGGAWTSQTSGEDIIILVDNGYITLEGAANLSVVNIKFKQTGVTLSSSADNTSLIGGSGNDSLYIGHHSVTASGGSGNDTIHNSSGSHNSINAGDGNDSIFNPGGNWYSTIRGGTGNDNIYNRSWYTSIDGGSGNDTIVNYWGSSTLSAGQGNDVISLSSYESNSLEYSNERGNVILYSSGDGNDIIYDWNSNDTLEIGGGTGTYSSQQSGDDVIVTVGDGKISLIGAASLGSSLNIDGSSDSKLITLTEGADEYSNTVEDATIQALGGNDTIYNNSGERVSIHAGAGNDSIYHASYSPYSTILGGSGNDTIYNYSHDVTINGGDGNDYIYSGNYAAMSINGGAGSDTVYTNSDGGKTLTGGTGSDLFKFYYDSDTLYGTDVITDYAEEDTIQFNNVAVTSITTSGNDVVFKAGDNELSVIGAADKVITYIDADGTTKTYGEVSNLITGTSSSDYITNTVEGATIDALGGKDTIDNSGSYVSINAGSGNDSIYSNVYVYGVTINAGDGADNVYNYDVNGSYTDLGAGNDSIYSYDEDASTINGGSGNDTISGNYWSSSLNGGAGADVISLGTSYNNTITGGTGNDTIYITYNYGNLYQYSSGDGNDRIVGFSSNDTLQIDGGTGSYSSQTSGDNIIVTVGDGKITLVEAATVGVYIDGVEETVEENSWTYNNGTAKYGTSNRTLITIKGVKSADGLSLNDNVVTVAKASVNAKKITLTGDGYTLALADDINTPTTKKVAWSYSNGTATYKSSYKTAGYKLASDAKSITYSKATTASTLATVKGVKSKNGLSVSGKKITVAKSSLNAKKVTLTGDGYTLKLANAVTTPTTKKAWSLDDTTATYNQTKSAGYTLASNGKSISYSKATSSTLATVKGATSKYKSGLSVSDKKITLKNSALNKKVTVSGGYEFNFASDYKNATITGSKSADSITARGANISINAGAGADTIKLFSKSTVTGGAGADTFLYNKGNVVIADYAAEDTISIASGTVVTSTSDNNLILTIGTSKITVTGGNDGKKVTYIDSGGTHTYQKASDTLEGVDVTNKGKVVTLTDDYEADKFDVVDLSNYKSKIITINAANVPRGLEITANSNSNSIMGTNAEDKIYGLDGADTILGGKGSDYIEGGDGEDSISGGTGSDSLWGGLGDDTLYGGAGNDFFIYNGNDDGHDTIMDYADTDRIMILSGEKPALAYTPQSNSMTFNIGNGSIVIENPHGQNINFVKGDGTYLHHEAVVRSVP